MNRFRWVFFDLFDTLVLVDEKVYYDGKREAAEAAGLDPEEFLAAWRGTAEAAMTGKFKDPFQRAGEALRTMLINDRAIAAKIALSDIETLQSSVTFYDGATDSLSALRERGFKLALLSNAAATTAFIVSSLHLRNRLDQLVLSYEVGAKKPDPIFFGIALKKTGASPGEVLFVGDGANNELDAARDAGFSTLRMNHEVKARTFMNKETLSSPDHREVRSFGELLGLDELAAPITE